MSLLRACLILLFAGMAASAAPKPPHDIWLEGEDCTDHDFTFIGREAAFQDCYGSAILQLQDRKQAPPEGRHATFHATIPESGWWEIRAATTSPAICPFSVQVDDYRERRFTSLQSEQHYGHNNLFGWYLLGSFELPAGDAAITFRSRDRRGTHNDCLLYIDALALRRVPKPADDSRRWLAPDGHGEAVLSASFAASYTRNPVVSLCCDGTVTVELNGEELGTANDADVPWHTVSTTDLKPAGNTLRLRMQEAAGGDRAVVAWVTADGDCGARPIVCATDETWEGGGHVLGGAYARPWGDITIFPPARLPLGRLPIPIKTGNLSVGLLIKAARGEEPPKPGPLTQLQEWRDLGGVSSVEDYICWLPLEPEQGRFDWSYYENNCRELERHGMGYSVYPWLHFPPKWALGSDLWDPLLCNRHGTSTFAPSIWAPATRRLFDRFYRELHRQFGDRIDQVYIGVVADYGEIGYPIGMANRLVPSDHIHEGFWCADAHAQADFRQRMLARYEDLPALNRAWGTAFAEPADIASPPGLDSHGPDDPWLTEPANRRRWLDFVDWYYTSMERFCEEAVAISRRYFPDRPHELKIGFGRENVCLGSDPTLYISRSRAGMFTVRSTHGKLSPYFYRRFSTAARHYGVPLVTEPPAGVNREEELQRIFKDATSGTTEYFDYPGNLLGANDLFRRFGPYMEGQHSLTNLAFFMPSTNLRLHPCDRNPRSVVSIANACRDTFDWDLVDERLIRDGALGRYGVLFLVEGSVIERDVLVQVEDWVRAGGVLIATDFGPVETVEGDREMVEKWFVPAEQLPSAEAVFRAEGHPLPVCFIPIGTPGDEPFLAGDWHGYESGHWEWGGEKGEITKRWTGARPHLCIPVTPGRKQHLAIAVARHPKLLEAPCEVKTNGQSLGFVPTTRTGVFRAEIPAEAIGDNGLLHLELLPRPWQPSVLTGSSDTRCLGVAVRWVKVWQDDAAEPEVPSLPELAWQLDTRTVTAQLSKPLGKGLTIRLPVASDETKICTQLLAQVVAAGPAVLPEQACWPQLDGGQDNVWTALLPNRILFYNPNEEAAALSLHLDPGAFARTGLSAPARSCAEITVPANSLASIELPACTVRRP